MEFQCLEMKCHVSIFTNLKLSLFVGVSVFIIIVTIAL